MKRRPSVRELERRVLRAAARWRVWHCDQLTNGTCEECTRLYKAQAALAARRKK